MSLPHSQTEQIARVCHEANRAWCEANGDLSQKPWDEAADWQRSSAVEGVAVALSGAATPGAQHDAWRDSKLRDGWAYGPVKDADARTHPCLVPYEDLPAVEQAKDHLFVAVAVALGQALAA